MAYKKRITISLSDKVLENLENLSKEKGLSKSAMITLALEEYARKESKQKKIIQVFNGTMFCPLIKAVFF